MGSEILSKVTSRKFLVALVGVISGIALLFTKNYTEGTVTLVTSIVGYILAEGYVDAKAVKNVAEAVDLIVKEVVKETENKNAEDVKEIE